MTRTIRLDRVTHYCPRNSVHSRLWPGSSLQRREESRLLQSNGNHSWLRHDQHHTGPPLLYVVLSTCFPWGPIRVAWVMCRQWGIMHLVRDVSRRGVVFKVPGVWVLCGLKAYECLPHGKARPKRWREPDRVQNWHVAHLGPCTWRQPTPRHNTMACVGPSLLLGQIWGWRLSLVPRVPQHRGTDTCALCFLGKEHYLYVMSRM
jgi:hypothetical protein